MPLTDKPKQPCGRPRKFPWSEKMDAMPEEVAEKVLQVKPPKEWEYLKRRRNGTT